AATAVPDPNATTIPAAPAGGTTPPAGSPPAPAPTTTQSATDLASQLKAWIAAIPDLLVSNSLGRSAMRATQSIPIAFVAAAAAAVDASPGLQALNRLDLD